MKAPIHFAALSELTGRDFKKQAVITPKCRFDFYARAFHECFLCSHLNN